MKYKILLLIGVFLSGILTVVYAQEPLKPDVSRMFNFEKEEKINHLSNVSTEEAFKKLTALEFMFDENLLHKAIYKAFEHRKSEAVALVINNLTLHQHQTMNGKIIDSENSLYIARNFLAVFPEEAMESLLKLYNTADPPTRANIIYTAGNMSGQRIKDLLIQALDDKTVFEKENPEIMGYRLRICDVAYNQLVIRYKINNILRTIGNEFKAETRDYHINILKKKL